MDLLDFEDLAKSLEVCGTLTVETDAQYQNVLSLYTGDLLAGSAQEDWAISRSVPLHGQYITLVYAYLDLLKAAGRQEEIIQGCRFALENDPFDQRLHLELMQALVKTNRNNEALMQYKHVTHMHFRYLGVDPPQGIQEFYQQIIRSSDTLDMNLDAIRCELQEFGEVQGASECDYPVFRQIFNLQMRNLERLGVSMCIGIIMISTGRGASQPPEAGRDHERAGSDAPGASAQGGHLHPFQPFPVRDAAAGGERGKRPHGAGAGQGALLPTLPQQQPDSLLPRGAHELPCRRTQGPGGNGVAPSVVKRGFTWEALGYHRSKPKERRRVMAVVELTQDQFEAEVLKSDKPVLVDFYADWCGPCKMVAPLVQQVAEESDHYKVYKVNVDHSPELAARYSGTAFPP